MCKTTTSSDLEEEEVGIIRKSVWKMAEARNSSVHSIGGGGGGAAEEEHDIGVGSSSGTSGWVDHHQHQQRHHHSMLHLAGNPSTSMNPFLVGMTNCDEDYFNTQEVINSFNPRMYL